MIEDGLGGGSAHVMTTWADEAGPLVTGLLMGLIVFFATVTPFSIFLAFGRYTLGGS